jgi:hypothetical protein
MSRNSKAKRDARKKNEPKRPIRRLGNPLQPHAQLEDADGNAIGGVGWRDREWLMVLGGRVVARTESAAMGLAMLKHVVALQEQAGHTVSLTYSPAMKSAATREAAAAGQTLDAYLEMLERERVERSAEQGNGMSTPDAPTQH